MQYQNFQFSLVADVHDNDDYLKYLQDVLVQVHTTYYEAYDKFVGGDLKHPPDIRGIVPFLRSKVNQSPLSFLNISLPWFNFLFNGYNGLTNNHQLTYKQTMFSHFYRTYQYVDPHLNKSIPLMNSTPRTPKCSTWGFPTMVA